MRYEVPGGRFNAGFTEGIADGRYHHGFHGGPALFMLIGLIIIFTAWVFMKNIKKRKSGRNHFAFPALTTDESAVAYSTISSQRAAILDQWERKIMKEEHENGHF